MGEPDGKDQPKVPDGPRRFIETDRSLCEACLNLSFFFKLTASITLSLALSLTIAITINYTFNLNLAIFKSSPSPPAAAPSIPCCEVRCDEGCDGPRARKKPTQTIDLVRADYREDYVVVYPPYPPPRRRGRRPMPPPCDPCWDFGWDEDADD
jgi:hypothetical protein